jgi:hypothetical protein
MTTQLLDRQTAAEYDEAPVRTPGSAARAAAQSVIGAPGGRTRPTASKTAARPMDGRSTKRGRAVAAATSGLASQRRRGSNSDPVGGEWQRDEGRLISSSSPVSSARRPWSSGRGAAGRPGSGRAPGGGRTPSGREHREVHASGAGPRALAAPAAEGAYAAPSTACQRAGAASVLLWGAGWGRASGPKDAWTPDPPSPTGAPSVTAAD